MGTVLCPHDYMLPGVRLSVTVSGIAALYKFGQCKVNPGDMLFLMRNLAANCTGLHRIAARCGFKKVTASLLPPLKSVVNLYGWNRVMVQLCTQWTAEHQSLHGHDNSSDVQDIMEASFTLAQLIRPCSLTWEMYQETDTGAPAADDSNHGTPLNQDGGAVWEDAEGKQENENDFASRIDVALSCSNLKFMIYSLTGDRRYFTLKSEPGDETGSMVDLSAADKGGAITDAAVLKQAGSVAGEASPVLTAVQHSEFIVYPSGYVPPAPSKSRQSCVKWKTGIAHTGGKQGGPPERRCNPLRATKLALLKNLAEEFGNLDQFGSVTEEIAQQFMEIAAVVASSRVFIKENIKYLQLADIIGIDLDAFALSGRPEGSARSSKRGSDSASDISSASSRGRRGGGRSTGSTSSRGSAKSGDRFATRASFTGPITGPVNYSKENCIDSKFHGKDIYTGALCWPYIMEEIGFDIDLRVDKTLVGYQVKRSTLSTAVRNLARVRVYRGLEHFTSAEGVLNREAYKQQCYFATHVVYAFSDWGQHALRRHLFAEEFHFFVTNFASVLDVLKDPELVGEFMHCIRILQVLCIW
jgi:hypothetical protein